MQLLADWFVRFIGWVVSHFTESLMGRVRHITPHHSSPNVQEKGSPPFPPTTQAPSRDRSI